MDKQEYEIMEKKIKKYKDAEKNIERAKSSYNDFINNTPHYVENREGSYAFTTHEALSKFRTSVLECIKIELEVLETEMEEL